MSVRMTGQTDSVMKLFGNVSQRGNVPSKSEYREDGDGWGGTNVDVGLDFPTKEMVKLRQD